MCGVTSADAYTNTLMWQLVLGCTIASHAMQRKPQLLDVLLSVSVGALNDKAI